MVEFQNTPIRKKLIFIQLATAFLAVFICCTFFVYNDIRIFKETSISNKYSIAEIIGINAAPTLEFADRDAANKMLLKLQSNPSILNAVILDKVGKEFARYNKRGEETFSLVSPGENDKQTQKGLKQKFLVSYKIIDKEFLGIVVLRAELTGFGDIIFGYLKIALVILIVSLVVAFVISNLLQRSITNRLLSLVYKTKEVADTGNYSIRVSDEGKDEIATLSSAYNNMLEQIEKMQGVLKGTNVELEKRVKARTVELETANKKLQSTSEELAVTNRELEQFVYIASHDLQEPLRTLSNYAGLLTESYSGKPNEPAGKYLERIMNASSKMRTLIKDLLDFSRVGKTVDYSETDTKSILKDVIAEMDASIRDSKAIITSSGLPVLKGNEIELKQIFQNLISNAIKFRNKDTAPKISVTAEEKPTEYLFAVKDNGIGIEEQYKNRIFIVFQRLHGSAEYPGTGIGLATVQKIVTMHKGKIWVESKLGEGSTFYFTISKNI